VLATLSYIHIFIIYLIIHIQVIVHVLYLNIFNYNIDITK